jgi:hypothetical protein
MTNSPSSAGSDTVVAPLAAGLRRERVRVRRRRARQGHAASEKWSPRSRRRTLQTVFVCAGALLLMGAALYFSLSHQGAEPQGSVRGVPVGARGAA